MQTFENPYSAPTTHDEGTLETDFDLRPILRRWEKLRVVYNLVLVGLVCLITIPFFPQHLQFIEFWMTLLIGAVAANVCFLLGPAVDAYLQWFRLWHISLTTAMFVVGTGIAAALAAFTVTRPPLVFWNM